MYSSKHSGEIKIAIFYLLPFFWSLFLTHTFYPGVMSYDTRHIWTLVEVKQTTSWHPIGLTSLIWLTQLMQDTVWPLTFFQSFYFFFSSLFFVRCLVGNTLKATLYALIILFNPLFCFMSIAVQTSTWGVIFGVLFVALVIKYWQSNRKIDYYLAILVLLISILFRKEMICLAPIIFLIDHNNLSLKLSHQKAISFLSFLFLAFLFFSSTKFLPNDVAKNSSPAAHGILNHYIGTIYNAKNIYPNFNINLAKQTIDHKYQEGTFAKILKNYECEASAYLVFKMPGKQQIFHSLSGETRYFLRLLIQAIYEYPLAWLSHQLCYMSGLLQVSKFYFRLWDLSLPEFAFENYPQIQGFLQQTRNNIYNLILFILDNSYVSWLAMHVTYVVILFAGFLLGLYKRNSILCFLSIVGLTYFLFFSLIGPNIHWRYLFFTHILGIFQLIYLIEIFLKYKKDQQINT